MSNLCTPILVGVAFLVLEIELASNLAKFPFQTMDCSQWESKYRIGSKNSCKKRLTSCTCALCLMVYCSLMFHYYIIVIRNYIYRTIL